jgi:hypothetical protein
MERASNGIDTSDSEGRCRIVGAVVECKQRHDVRGQRGEILVVRFGALLRAGETAGAPIKQTGGKPRR